MACHSGCEPMPSNQSTKPPGKDVGSLTAQSKGQLGQIFCNIFHAVGHLIYSPLPRIYTKVDGQSSRSCAHCDLVAFQSLSHGGGSCSCSGVYPDPSDVPLCSDSYSDCGS